MSINDLVAFATGVRFAIDAIEMIEVDDKLAARIGVASGENWLLCALPAYEGSKLPVCYTEVYITGSSPPSAGSCNAYRTIFHLIEDLFARASWRFTGNRSSLIRRRWPGLKVKPGPRRLKCSAPTNGRGQDRASRDQHPPRLAIPSCDDDAARQGMSLDLLSRNLDSSGRSS